MPSPPPPFPLLLLLSLLFNPSTASPSPSPLPNPSPEPVPHYHPAALPHGIHLPLHRRSSALTRRSDPDTIRSWALREKGRLTVKYGAGVEERLAKRQTTSTRTTSFSVARLPSTTSGNGSGSGSRTSRATASPTATSVVGKVDVMNFEADL